jgi:hypothetical protein
VTTNAETGILMSRSPTATEDIRSAFNESPSNPLSDQQNSRHASHGSNFKEYCEHVETLKMTPGIKKDDLELMQIKTQQMAPRERESHSM